MESYDCVRPLGGGGGGLLQRTEVEWATIKVRIDSGVPCPIGLVYTNTDVWNQHQILVYGYDDTDMAAGYTCMTPTSPIPSATPDIRTPERTLSPST